MNLYVINFIMGIKMQFYKDFYIKINLLGTKLQKSPRLIKLAKYGLVQLLSWN